MTLRYDDETEDEEQSFNLHLRNAACSRQFSSYRATFMLQKSKWETKRLTWSDFVGKGPGVSSTE